MNKAILITILFAQYTFVAAAAQYYTYGFEPNVPAGALPTAVSVTVEGKGRLYLVDNPPIGLVRNDGDIIAISQLAMTRRVPVWLPTLLADANNLGEISLGDVVADNNWTHGMFGQPMYAALSNGDKRPLSPVLLEFIDYAGNGTPVGFLVVGELERIEVRVTAETWEGEYGISTETYEARPVMTEAERARALAEIAEEVAAMRAAMDEWLLSYAMRRRLEIAMQPE